MPAPAFPSRISTTYFCAGCRWRMDASIAEELTSEDLRYFTLDVNRCKDGGMIEDRCFCGTVRYRIQEPVKFVAHDHCSICRRIAGAAFVTWFGVQDESQFELVSGTDALTTFASSAEATRQFCRQCGSHLFFRSSRWPGEVHITLASVTHGAESLIPLAHVFYSDRVPWCAIEDALPKLGGPSGVMPL